VYLFGQDKDKYIMAHSGLKTSFIEEKSYFLFYLTDYFLKDATLGSDGGPDLGHSILPSWCSGLHLHGGGADLVPIDGDVVIFENLKEDFPGLSVGSRWTSSWWR
jgi:hypothetical protein